MSEKFLCLLSFQRKYGVISKDLGSDVVGEFFGHSGLESVDSHLDLLKTGLAGSDTLHKKTGRGDDLNEEVLAVLARQHYKLKADTDDHGQNGDLDECAVEDIIQRNNGERAYHYAYQNDNEHK